MRKYKFFYIFIISIFFFFISCASDISKKIDEDLEYLYKYWEQGYVAYDEARGNGLNLEKNIKKIKRLYKKQVRFSKKNNPQNVLYENGIDKYSLGVLIQSLTFDKAKIKDKHYVLDAGSISFGLFSETPYFSNIYFRISEDKYVVEYSDIPEISKNQIYTGDKNNLVKSVFNDSYLYRFVCFSKKNIKTTSISIEGKEIEIPIRKDFYQIEDKSFYYETSDKSIYIKMPTCVFNNNEEYNHFRKLLEEIYKVNKQNVIIDFRNNNGGLRKYPYELLQAVFLNNNDSENNRFNHIIQSVENGKKILKSALIQEKLFDYSKDYFLATDEEKNLLSSDLSDFKKNNTREVIFNHNTNLINIKRLKSRNDSTVYILLNNTTASATEAAILLCKAAFNNNVILIGENSSGCMDFGGYYDYVLPNSKITIGLSYIDFRNSYFVKNAQIYHGDTKGIFPDLWITSDELGKILSYLLKDEKILYFIK